MSRAVFQHSRHFHATPALSLPRGLARVRARQFMPPKQNVETEVRVHLKGSIGLNYPVCARKALKCFVCLAKAGTLYGSKLPKFEIEARRSMVNKCSVEEGCRQMKRK